MADPLDEVLRMVAEGRISAADAAPVLDALAADREAGDQDADPDVDPSSSGPGSTARTLRIEISDEGRQVVNLRIPMALGRIALDHVPGLSADNLARIHDALDHRMLGSILDVNDDGDGVRIVLE